MAWPSGSGVLFELIAPAGVRLRKSTLHCFERFSWAYYACFKRTFEIVPHVLQRLLEMSSKAPGVA